MKRSSLPQLGVVIYSYDTGQEQVLPVDYKQRENVILNIKRRIEMSRNTKAVRKMLGAIIATVFLAACGGTPTANAPVIPVPEETPAAEVMPEPSEVLSTEESETSDDIAEVAVPPFPITEQLIMFYPGGVDGWWLALDPDGTFEGEFLDYDLGGMIGSRAESRFTGHFEVLEQSGEYEYVLRITALSLEHKPGEEWTDEYGPVIALQPYVFAFGQEFLFFVPGQPLAELPEPERDWIIEFYDLTESTLTFNILMPLGSINGEYENMPDWTEGGTAFRIYGWPLVFATFDEAICIGDHC